MGTKIITVDPAGRNHSSEERRAALSLACFLAEYGWPLRVPVRQMTLRELWDCPDALLAGLLKLPQTSRARLTEFRSRFSAEAMLEQLNREGISLVTLGESGYPHCLAQIHDPPPALFLKGATTLSAIMEQPRVAIVGARAASRYGLDAASSIARSLSRYGICVVSGMALGIDAASHTGSLEHPGRSLAVLGCGPDVVYPAANRPLHASLLESGLVISEYPPKTQPMPLAISSPQPHHGRSVRRGDRRRGQREKRFPDHRGFSTGRRPRSLRRPRQHILETFVRPP